MDVVENATTSLKKESRHQNIPLISLFDHLYGKTKPRKLGPNGVLTTKEDQVVVAQVLAMQKVGLLMSLQQFKMRVAKFIQTRSTFS